MTNQSFTFCKEISRLWIGGCILLGSVFVSCSDDKEKEVAVAEPFKMEIEVPASGETKTIEVQAIADWKLTTTNSSMIDILSSKVGGMGIVKVEFRVNQNNTFKMRSAELNFTDGRNNVIKVTQAAANADMSFNKPVQIAYNPDKKIFTDTVVVTSNLLWELPSQMPDWIEEMRMIDGEPQENTTTHVKLVIIAKQDALKASGNSEEVVLAKKDDHNFVLTIRFAGYTPKIDFDDSKVVLIKDIMNASQFIGSITVNSNVKWSLDQEGVTWLDQVDPALNKSANAVETFSKIWFTMDAQRLDTDGLTGSVTFKDLHGDFTKSLSLEVNAPDADYILVKSDLTMADNAVLPAINTNPDQPNGIIRLFAKDPSRYQPVVFLLHNGRLKATVQPIAFIDPASVSTRAELGYTEWHLFAKDRMEFESYQGMDPYSERTGVVLFLPESMLQWGDVKDEYLDFVGGEAYLKDEYFVNEVMYRQAGLTAEAPQFGIIGVPDGTSLQLNAAGGTQKFAYELNFNIEREGVYTLPGDIDWCKIHFDTETNSLEFETTANTSGKQRNEKIEFIHGKSDQTLYTVTIVQPSN